MGSKRVRMALSLFQFQFHERKKNAVKEEPIDLDKITDLANNVY